MKLSICLIVYNEEEHLEGCLDSVKEIAAEIVVVDTGSEDNTLSIARRYTEKVYQYDWQYSFADARNYAIKQATHPWILFLDADERLQDQEELKRLISKTDKEAFFVRIVNKVQGPSWEDLRLSLFKNHKGYLFRNPIHEEIISSIREAGKGDKVAKADIRILHYGYSLSKEAMVKKAERNREILLRHLRTSSSPLLPYFWAAELLQQDKYRPALNALLYSWNHSSPNSYYLSDVLLKIIYTCIRLERISQAKEWLQTGTKLYPELTELNTFKATILFLEGKYGEAQRYLKNNTHEALEFHVKCKYALAREVLKLGLNKFPQAHMLTEKLDILSDIKLTL